MTLTAEQVREIIRDEIRTPRKAAKPRSRHFVQFAVTTAEKQIIEAVAAQRGMCVADFIRSAVEPELPCELPRNRVIPVNLRENTRPRHDKLRDDARRGLIASRLLARETDAAVGQTAPAVPVPKLRGPQRPE